jgi:glycerophosphoryl diester phosphodiesterase
MTWIKLNNIIIISLLGVVFSACNMSKGDSPDASRPTVAGNVKASEYKLIAHRGGIVENLFNEFDPRSIQAAIDSGYYMLEIDVRETKDGMLVVHHDSDFKRFFNDPRKVEDLTWDEITQLRSDKGLYHPLSFDTVARMCAGKVRMMMDIKPSHPSPEFFSKLGEIMERYGLLSDAYFIDRDAREYFSGKARFEFRVREAEEIRKRLEQGEDVASHFFLFDHGNRLNAETVKWCQQNNIAVVASVNIGHYKFENHMEGAFRDIEYWKACGVTEYQIDSDYDQWLPHAKLAE